MNAKLPESPSIQMQTETQPVMPDPEESHVQLSPTGRLCHGARGDVSSLVDGRFSNMYELSLATHDEFGLHGEEPFPSENEVAGSFTSEEFNLTLEYQNPALVMVPPHKTREYIFAALSACCKRGVRTSTMISNSEDRPENPDSSNMSEDGKYRSFIAEAACQIQPDDDRLGSYLMGRINHKQITRQPEEWGMTEDLYILLAMQGITRGEQIDRETFTILDYEPIVTNHSSFRIIDNTMIVPRHLIPVGHCRKQMPTLEWLPHYMQDAYRGRFRRVLGGRCVADC
ncbi:MAG TPA: hypothetical protein ENL10_01400 [Candidatus Cloacimonetes bacterium]|nr:hypothetical protein [Candidatus Cloacimonadota bacterium]